MKFRNVTPADLDEAADAAHVNVTYESRGRILQGTLTPIGDTYRRTGQNETSRGNYRRINAVCYHGHLAFFRVLYRLAPEAIVQSAMATYRSAEDLERDAHIAAERNIGSEYRPLRYQDACTCHDYNVSGVLPTWQPDGTARYGDFLLEIPAEETAAFFRHIMRESPEAFA